MKFSLGAALHLMSAAPAGGYQTASSSVTAPPSRRSLTRGQLIDLSPLHNDATSSRSIDVQIGRLCRWIERDPARPWYIRNERGTDYVFAVPVQTFH